MTTANPGDRINAFRTQIQAKIERLVQEFADGQISREQFHAVYDRYSSQLALAEMAVQSMTPATILDSVNGGESTIAVKEQHMGKAVGLCIFNRLNAMLLETLGSFEVPPEQTRSILQDFRKRRDEQQVRQIGPSQWLLIAAGRHTTVVTLFRNEPSQMQVNVIARLHTDFERANAGFFAGDTVDADQLAYPFLTFIQQTIRGGSPA
jgi:hypothetical protein